MTIIDNHTNYFLIKVESGDSEAFYHREMACKIRELHGFSQITYDDAKKTIYFEDPRILKEGKYTAKTHEEAFNILKEYSGIIKNLYHKIAPHIHQYFEQKVQTIAKSTPTTPPKSVPITWDELNQLRNKVTCGVEDISSDYEFHEKDQFRLFLSLTQIIGEIKDTSIIPENVLKHLITLSRIDFILSNIHKQFFRITLDLGQMLGSFSPDYSIQFVYDPQSMNFYLINMIKGEIELLHHATCHQQAFRYAHLIDSCYCKEVPLDPRALIYALDENRELPSIDWQAFIVRMKEQIEIGGKKLENEPLFDYQYFDENIEGDIQDLEETYFSMVLAGYRHLKEATNSFLNSTLPIIIRNSNIRKLNAKISSKLSELDGEYKAIQEEYIENHSEHFLQEGNSFF